ncbi:DUF4956 domain-containing protein [Rarobacter faecitabidus]|uniref:Uncharacterized protein DUF4956 n=1 Tax=Rarobacter faecitabidus TaxID=13243 RepID=A0A542ZXY1_RARFA|nr:DUF4956 domain-containing protein [Rarobacter faecitabidus]TQL65056.1 uncharacterized protein DUF4956 [Rarobacter faecitabidus]
MNALPMIAADLVAIGLLTFALYFRRHHRRDLVVAFLGVNVGVLAVSLLLSASSIGLGLGLGLFGVLSIIRLRSTEIAQHEVAYYFSALALGLTAGLSAQFDALALAMMGAIVATMWVGDSSLLLRGYRSQVMVLDHAVAREEEAAAAAGGLLGAEVKHISIVRTDYVNDSTVVDVRYRLGVPRQRRGGHDPEEAALARLVQGERSAVLS